MGKQKESSSSQRGMVGSLCVGGKGRQTSQRDTGREPAMSWKPLVCESTPRGRNQRLNLLAWDWPYYIAKWGGIRGGGGGGGSGFNKGQKSEPVGLFDVFR